jgi:peptidoglycan hydrolase-like protein with peptidoglycan-binding domain
MTLSHGRVRRLRRATCLGAITATLAVGVATPSYASIESSYLGILNQERTSHGLPPLSWNAELAGVARGWAAHMAATRVLSHNPALTRQISGWQSIGENVGDGPDLRDLADAFWASAEHRDNILDRGYTQVGIAAVVANHTIWIAIDFREPLHTTTTAPASPPRGVSRMHQQSWPGRLLMRGSTGWDVAYVQRVLSLPATAYFGARTQQAVFAFQRNHHLAVDGIVGPITWAALQRRAAHRSIT